MSELANQSVRSRPSAPTLWAGATLVFCVIGALHLALSQFAASAWMSPRPKARVIAAQMPQNARSLVFMTVKGSDQDAREELTRRCVEILKGTPTDAVQFYNPETQAREPARVAALHCRRN